MFDESINGVFFSQPVNKAPGGRIAPVSAALASARRDPRLARGHAPAPRPAPAVPAPAPAVPIAPNVFDIKPLERVTKRKNVITIDVRPDAADARPADARPAPRDPRRRDPRLAKRDDRRRDRPRPPRPENNDPAPPEQPAAPPEPAPTLEPDSEAKRISRLPPIPKIRREPDADDQAAAAAAKRRKEVREDRRRRREATAGKDSGSSSSPEKKARAPKDTKEKDKEPRRRRERRPDPQPETAPEVAPEREDPALVAFKELRNYHKERYMRRNKEKSESPEPAPPAAPAEPDATSKISLYPGPPAARPVILACKGREPACVRIKYLPTLGVLYSGVPPFEPLKLQFFEVSVLVSLDLKFRLLDLQFVARFTVFTYCTRFKV